MRTGTPNLGFTGLLWLLALGGCDGVHNGFLNAQGRIAGEEHRLFLIVVIVLLFVIGPVLLLTPLMAWHYRLSNTRNAFRPTWNFSPVLEFFIWVPPSLIVVGLAVLLWNRTHRLDPYRPIASAAPVLEIEAVALDWKWLFVYPDAHVATINRLVIPAGRSVHLRLTSGTVMQSLLIPQLAGQIYAMPGMTTQLNLAADRPGVYRGANAQYNGAGFARQHFAVIALPAANYDRWAAQAPAAGKPLDTAAYNRLFVRATEPRPMLFSRVPDDLYARILARSGAATMSH